MIERNHLTSIFRSNYCIYSAGNIYRVIDKIYAVSIILYGNLIDKSVDITFILVGEKWSTS